MDGRLDMFDIEIPTRFIALYPYLPEYKNTPEQAFGVREWDKGGNGSTRSWCRIKANGKGNDFFPRGRWLYWFDGALEIILQNTLTRNTTPGRKK
ncbi:hypothetical protein FTV92_12955 [Escherichia coli]|nr:hypothetical protein FTV92_12955 [Escherichia coli]